MAKVDTLTLKDGRVIDYNGRAETPTSGSELTAIEQLIGEIGNGELNNNNTDVNPGSRPGQ